MPNYYDSYFESIIVTLYTQLIFLITPPPQDQRLITEEGRDIKAELTAQKEPARRNQNYELLIAALSDHLYYTLLCWP